MTGYLKALFVVSVLGLLLAGCGGGGGGGGDTISTVSFIDVTPPSVVYTTPVHNESGVGTNSKITVTFSEAVNPATITNDTFQLVKTTILPGTAVTLNPGDVTYDQTNRIATISPSALEGSQDYTVTVKGNVVRDLAGNTMTAPYDWTFTTDAVADLTAPVLLSKAPVAGAVNVGTNTVIAMSFSKPMDISTFPLAFSLKLGPASITGQFALIGQVVVFTPDSSLQPNQTYTATVDTSATDMSVPGIPLAAPVTWSFTTGGGADSTPPTVDWTIPAIGDTNIALNTPITVKFNEPIYPFLYGSIDGKVTKAEFDYDNNIVTMTPTVSLTPQHVYPAFIRARDLAGNLMTVGYSWTFTTGN